MPTTTGTVTIAKAVEDFTSIMLPILEGSQPLNDAETFPDVVKQLGKLFETLTGTDSYDAKEFCTFYALRGDTGSLLIAPSISKSRAGVPVVRWNNKEYPLVSLSSNGIVWDIDEQTIEVNNQKKKIYILNVLVDAVDPDSEQVNLKIHHNPEFKGSKMAFKNTLKSDPASVLAEVQTISNLSTLEDGTEFDILEIEKKAKKSGDGDIFILKTSLGDFWGTEEIYGASLVCPVNAKYSKFTLTLASGESYALGLNFKHIRDVEVGQYTIIDYNIKTTNFNKLTCDLTVTNGTDRMGLWTNSAVLKLMSTAQPAIDEDESNSCPILLVLGKKDQGGKIFVDCDIYFPDLDVIPDDTIRSKFAAKQKLIADRYRKQGFAL